MITPFVHLVPLVAALLFTTACGAAEDRAAPAETTGSRVSRGHTAQASAARLEHDGVSIELPRGWKGRVLPLDDPAAVLQAANFELAPVGAEPPPGNDDPIKAMTARHALVAILPCGVVESEEPPRPAPERLSLDDLSFLPLGHPRIPHRHALAQGSFDFSGRCLRVEADFGGAPPWRGLSDTINRILASLSVVE
jgi:hypothetical protein